MTKLVFPLCLAMLDATGWKPLIMSQAYLYHNQHTIIESLTPVWYSRFPFNSYIIIMSSDMFVISVVTTNLACCKGLNPIRTDVYLLEWAKQ